MFHITQLGSNRANQLLSTTQKEESRSWRCLITVWTKYVGHPLKHLTTRECSCAATSTSTRPCMVVTSTRSLVELLTSSSWSLISLQDSLCGHFKIYSADKKSWLLRILLSLFYQIENDTKNVVYQQQFNSFVAAAVVLYVTINCGLCMVFTCQLLESLWVANDCCDTLDWFTDIKLNH